jgi:hypothetical protein
VFVEYVLSVFEKVQNLEYEEASVNNQIKDGWVIHGSIVGHERKE